MNMGIISLNSSIRDRDLFKNELGLSLIELVLTLGISAIAFFGTTTFFINNANEQKKIQARLANIDFKRSILNTLLSQTANNIACFSELTDGPYTNLLNVNAIDTQSPPVIHLKQLSSKLGDPPIFKVGETTSSYSDSYKVQSILVNNFKKTNHIELYTANLEIIIMNSKDRSTKKTLLHLNIRTETTPNSLKKIKSCMI